MSQSPPKTIRLRRIFGGVAVVALPVECCSRERIYRGAVGMRESSHLTQSKVGIGEPSKKLKQTESTKRSQDTPYILPLTTECDSHGRNVGFKGRRSHCSSSPRILVRYGFP